MASIATNAPTSDVGGSHISGSGSVAGSTQPHPTSQPRNASVSHQQQHCLYGSDPSQGFIKTEYQEHEGKWFLIQWVWSIRSQCKNKLNVGYVYVIRNKSVLLVNIANRHLNIFMLANKYKVICSFLLFTNIFKIISKEIYFVAYHNSKITSISSFPVLAKQLLEMHLKV